MDAMHVLTDATGRGWKTSEFVLACLAIVAILLATPSAGRAIAIAVIVGAYAWSRAYIKAATSRALLTDVPPPVQLVERAVSRELH